MKLTSFTKLTKERFDEHHVQNSLTKLSEKLYIDYTALTNETHSIIIYSVFNNDAFRFVFEELDEDTVAKLVSQNINYVADFMGEATAFIMNGDWDINIIGDKLTLIKIILQSINGEIAEILINNYQEEEEVAPEEPDPSLIYVQLVNGQLYTIPRNNINWDETIKNLQNIAAFQGAIKQMIFDLFKAPESELDNVKMRIREIIERECTNIGMTHDYKVFENLTEKEEILLYLFDINTVYEQIILIAASMDAQQQIMNALNALAPIDNNQESEEVDVEVVSEESDEMNIDEIFEAETDENS